MPLQAAHRPSEHVSPAQVERVAKGQHSTFSEKHKSISQYQAELLQQRPPFKAAGELQALRDGKHRPTPAPRPGEAGGSPAVSAPPARGVAGITGGLALQAPRGLQQDRAQAPSTPPERQGCAPSTHRRTLTHRPTHRTDECSDDLSAITEVTLITRNPLLS